MDVTGPWRSPQTTTTPVQRAAASGSATRRLGPDRRQVPPVPDVALADVRFAVVDVETTGGSPSCAFLTEIGMAVYVGGRKVDDFDQLVDPGVPIPPFITELTGIGDETVAGAPAVSEVLPELCRHLAGCVLVGHNLPFDVSFLDAALLAHDHPPLDHHRVDTLVLARQLLHNRVPNFKLGTLAAALSLPNQPSHRALADVFATADLLHWQLDRLAEDGVRRLPQLLAMAGLPG